MNVDQLMLIPAFFSDFLDHNKVLNLSFMRYLIINQKIELLKEELVSYGNILITELSSYLEFRSKHAA